ncbi:regulatory protein, luxR family [Pseudonocardia thermophila]|uniref:Regulatory protein, luxR family n=1 Tax=Pseudonocardia thermophila TaxID=1848 RepID=A0A1M6X9K6_PSETH|nr:LuxR family transcriptional regulator [Pseudonocardia thermophila]SHL02651.1 regulatory protein, luxR family [Pseudonocardia thermophila]
MTSVARLGVGIDLVGRGPELAALEAALRGAAAGRPAGVLLAGDAGVGKSRMVTETVERATAAGFTVLVGRCLDTADAALPYLPFTEIAGTLAAARPEIVAERPALRRLLPGEVVRDTTPGDDSGLGQLRVFDAVLSALDALSARSPTLLVVEDLHWADRSSRDLLVFLLSRLTAQRLVVLATYRRDDLHRRHPLRPVLSELVRLPTVERLELEPLGEAEALELVRRLAQRWTDGALTEDQLRRIARRSEGNAFFAEELVTAGSSGVPEGLAEVLMARIEALPAQTQRVLRIAAVSGRRVRHERLAAVSGLDDEDLDQALREAVAQHVLVLDRPGDPTADGYVFRHALLREAIYQELLPGERTRLHARHAEHLAAKAEPGSAAELAHHAYAGHDLVRALAASVVAADEADARSAPAEALFQLERALELWHTVPDPETVTGTCEAAVTRAASWYASHAGDPDRAVQLGRRAVELAEADKDDLMTARCARGLAQLLLDLPGHEPEALATARRALALLTEQPPSADLAWAHCTLARAFWRVDRPADADEHARAAVAVVDGMDLTGSLQHRAGEAIGAEAIGAKADGLITMSICAQHIGEDELSLRLVRDARRLAHRAGHQTVELRSYYNLGLQLFDSGRLAEAAEVFREGEQRAEEVGLGWSGYAIDLRVVHVLTMYQLGEWDRAEAAARIAGRAVSATVGSRLAAAGMLVAAARGRLAEVERQLAELANHSSADDQVMVLAGIAGAEAALWAGDPGEAARRVAAAIRGLQGVLERHLGTIALAAVGIGAQAALVGSGAVPAAAARAEAERLAALAEDAAAHGMPRSSRLGPEGRAWLAWARAELTRLTGPDPAAWTAAITAFEYEGGRPGAPGYRQGCGLLRRAEARLARGEPAVGAVADDLTAACATATRLGAEPLAGAARAAARRAGVRLASPAADRAPAGDPLTPRERAVLGLVAAGRTNRQVGEELYISEKTVSVHLSRVMAKLGASSRTEAVSVAYARGLLTPSTD